MTQSKERTICPDCGAIGDWFLVASYSPDMGEYECSECTCMIERPLAWNATKADDLGQSGNGETRETRGRP